MENAVTSNSVLNGTALRSINEPIVMYIEQFKMFGKSGADSIIKQCETVVSAEEQLSQHNFKRFLVEIDVEKSSSTYRKMKSIGKAAVRFKEIVELLPNEWTTLYALSVLENAEFNDLVQKKVIRPRMTAKDLKIALNKESITKEEFKITIDLSKYEIGRQAEVVRFIQANVTSLGVEAKITEALKQCVEQFSVSIDDRNDEGRG